MRQYRRWAILVSLFALAVWLCSRGILWAQVWRYTGPAKSVVMPVAGLSPEATRSTWHAPRSGGRQHEGADLFSPRGTPVVSATSGVVWRRGNDRLGGRVVTVLGPGPAFYYYAHLDDWAEGLKKGDPVRPGTPLGFVGNTGNARTTPPHLHFGIYDIGLMRTKPVDPIPFLAKRARPTDLVTARQAPKLEREPGAPPAARVAAPPRPPAAVPPAKKPLKRVRSHDPVLARGCRMW